VTLKYVLLTSFFKLIFVLTRWCGYTFEVMWDAILGVRGQFLHSQNDAKIL